MHMATEIDPQTSALVRAQSYNTDFEGRMAFVASSELARSCTADRLEFLGRNGTPAQPAALRRSRLSGKTGAGLDPCAALQVQWNWRRDRSAKLPSFSARDKTSGTAARDWRAVPKSPILPRRIGQSPGFWGHTLERHPSGNARTRVKFFGQWLAALSNHFLPHVGAHGFYQSGGAFGFRDQLQDAMTLVHTRRELLREQLLRAAAHQFREGDVQHWWHPPLGRGVRTHFSDDYLWLAYATCRYVETTGDTGVLDRNVPFLEGRAVKPDEEAYYDLPNRSAESGTLYEHCVRAIKMV
jgi:cyclic beta-1,2-glucan synthetase